MKIEKWTWADSKTNTTASKELNSYQDPGRGIESWTFFGCFWENAFKPVTLEVTRYILSHLHQNTWIDGSWEDPRFHWTPCAVVPHSCDFADSVFTEDTFALLIFVCLNQSLIHPEHNEKLNKCLEQFKWASVLLQTKLKAQWVWMLRLELIFASPIRIWHCQ